MDLCIIVTDIAGNVEISSNEFGIAPNRLLKW